MIRTHNSCKFNHMKILLAILTVFVCWNCARGQDNPFARVDYDSLVIYDMEFKVYENGRGRRIMSIIEEDGSLAPGVKKSVRILGKEASDFTANLGKQSSFGLYTASCFDPHFGAVYYKNGIPSAYITICLSCNTFRSNLEIPASQQGPEEYDGTIYYMRCGFSMSYRKYLNDLKKKYGFHYLNRLESPIFTRER